MYGCQFLRISYFKSLKLVKTIKLGEKEKQFDESMIV